MRLLKKKKLLYHKGNNTVQDNLQEGENISHYATGKCLCPECIRNLNSKNNNDNNNLIFKWAKDLNGHFSKEDIQIANEFMKKMLSIIKIKEI